MKKTTALIMALAVFLSATPSTANAGAMLKVWCNDDPEPKKWQFRDLQEARDFLRDECPPCVTHVEVKQVFIKGIDKPWWETEK